VLGQRQLGRASGTCERAGEHQRLVVTEQFVDQRPGTDGLGHALVGEREVGAPGVATRHRPLGGAMANEQDEGGQLRRMWHGQTG